MSEVSVQLAVVGGSALLIGFVVGRLFRRGGSHGSEEADWRVRVAARDRDLGDAVERLADAEIELQALRERLMALPSRDPETEAQIADLTEELGLADDELTRLRSLGVDKSPAGSSALARRLESLEVELSTLASLRCPDPSAHRRSLAGSQAPAAPPPKDDDLTLITGVGPGLAEILRAMGYRTFTDIAGLSDDDLEEITQVAGGVIGSSAREGWVESARRLAAHDAA